MLCAAAPLACEINDRDRDLYLWSGGKSASARNLIEVYPEIRFFSALFRKNLNPRIQCPMMSWKNLVGDNLRLIVSRLAESLIARLICPAGMMLWRPTMVKVCVIQNHNGQRNGIVLN